ncbi:MAG: NTP transferase domain-containing protein [Candidatus Magasanikbacteria bacterium]|nr:NTP transferase domain-containing protein [Candidatus Magasanikbacteria bacterium]
MTPMADNRILCVILAGGLGTRISDLAKDIPKSMIALNGRPFVDHQLRLLKQSGVQEVILSVGYRGEMIRDYVGDGASWGIGVSYVDEGADLRGTGGAIRFIQEHGKLPEKFFLLYGDSYLPVDYRAIWTAFDSQGLPALLTVLRNAGNWDKSNIIYKDNKIMLYDKFAEDTANMDYIDAGLAILTRDLVSTYFFDKERFDLAEIYTMLSKKSFLGSYEVFKRFYEVGSAKGLKELSDKFAHGAF